MTHNGKIIFSSNIIVILLMLDEKTHTSVYNSGDLLAITIAPNDKIQSYQSAERFVKFHDFYETKLKRIFTKHEIPFHFRIELSEPIGKKIDTQGPRLHLHGIIQLDEDKDVYFWLCQAMPDLLQSSILSVSHIRTSQEYDGWIKYINKQKQTMPSSAFIQSSEDVLSQIRKPTV